MGAYMCRPKITNVYALLLLFVNLDEICLVICRIKQTSIISHRTAEVGRRTVSARDEWMSKKKKKREKKGTSYNMLLLSQTSPDRIVVSHRRRHAFQRQCHFYIYYQTAIRAYIDIFLVDSLLNFALLVTGAWTTNRNRIIIYDVRLELLLLFAVFLFLGPIADAPPHRLAVDLFSSARQTHAWSVEQ